jgi:hypothetical protein
MSKARELAELSRTVSDSADATAITIDSSENTTFTGVVTANAGVVIDNMTIDAGQIDLSSGNLLLDSAGDIHLDADSEAIRIRHDGGDIGIIQMTSNDLILRSMVADKDLIFRGNDSDGGGVITALTLDMSAAGAATFNSSVTAAGLTSSGPINLTAGALAAAGNAGLSHRSSDNKVYLQAGTGGFNILDDQQNTHFFIDSAGDATFSGKVTIGGTSTTRLFNLDGTADAYMSFNPSSHRKFTIGSDNSGFLIFDDAAGEYRLNIDSSGDLILAANATGAALIKGVSGDQTDRNTGGYPQYTFVGNEGTGIRRPSANVLAFDAGGAERWRIDANGVLVSGGNTGVGVGGTPADANFAEVGPGYINLARDDAADADQILFAKNGAIHTKLKTINGAFVIDSASGNVHVTANSNSLNYNGSTLKPFDSDDGQIDLGTTDARYKDIYLSGGAYLGGTAAANELDDYEEGAFQTSLTCSSGAITLNGSHDELAYTKVGNLVTVTGYLYVSNVSSPGGILYIGLPFTSLSGSKYAASVSLSFNGLASGSTLDAWGIIDPNNNTIQVYVGSGSSVSGAFANRVVAATDIRVQATYMAA